MLTEQEAIEKAWIVVRREGVLVTGLKNVRKISIEDLLPHMKDSGPIWSVSFAQPAIEGGGRVADGNCVYVRVFDRTGEATIVLSK
jgi:hypothetical protein